MRIAVVGLGGVGGYIAANIAKNHEVVGFARGEHLKKIQSNGITIKEDNSSYNAPIDAKELKEANGMFDVVLFCVKSYDLKESYDALKEHINENSIIISFSNGVDNSEILKKLSDAKVLEGCVYILSHIIEPGIIRKKGKVFAAVFGGEDKEAVKRLSDIFEKADLRYKTPDDIKTALWKKYIFISTFATLTSYYDNSIGYVYEYHKSEAEVLLTEIAQFAKIKNIYIDDEIEKSLDTASKVPYESSTSMHLDYQNKKPTEVESLSGYVKTPLMQKMYNELKKR
jgi:2-dehydropantoate 2-reductase